MGIAIAAVVSTLAAGPVEADENPLGTVGTAAVQQRIYIADRIASGPADRTFVFGDPAGDLLTGDWNGDGRDGFASRTGSTLTLVDAFGRGARSVSFGRAGDITHVGDWNGDGTDTLGVQRGRDFHVTNSPSGGATQAVITYGKLGDDVFVGDWNGDGIDTFAIRRGNQFHIRNTVTSGPADVVFNYGRAGDEVLVGDWDTDGVDTFAVRRGNVIYIRNDFTTGVAERVIGYGKAADDLLVGDWNGDGVDTFAVRRAEAAPAPPSTAACGFAPPDSFWTADVRESPVHPRSGAYLTHIGLNDNMHADFGSGTWNGGPIGIPYVDVSGDQARSAVAFTYAAESDSGQYPIPPDAPIEGGPAANGDRHVLMRDVDNCVLYELYAAYPNGNGTWRAGSGAIFDLRSNQLRPAGWTSADAAGLAILPGLVRYEEVAAGHIDHAIRMTVPRSDRSYVWPARHQAGAANDPDLPPMGLWLRLRADADLSGLGPQARVVATAMQTHGVIVADNGSPWFISGVPDPRWSNDDLHTLRRLFGHDFEAIDSAGLMIHPDSGAIN